MACAIERYTLRAAGDDRNRILWTGPKTLGSTVNPKWDDGRKNARLSYDEGRTFPIERLIATGPAAYSDMLTGIIPASGGGQSR